MVKHQNWLKNFEAKRNSISVVLVERRSENSCCMSISKEDLSGSKSKVLDRRKVSQRRIGVKILNCSEGRIQIFTKNCIKGSVNGRRSSRIVCKTLLEMSRVMMVLAPTIIWRCNIGGLRKKGWWV